MRGDSAGSQAADLTSHFAFASEPQFPIFKGCGHTSMRVYHGLSSTGRILCRLNDEMWC